MAGRLEGLWASLLVGQWARGHLGSRPNLLQIGPNMALTIVPKWVPKLMKIEIAGLRHFLPLIQISRKFIYSFSLGFGALWVPLGSLLGPLEALLGGLWTQKP